ncbi:Uncharacterised protein [Serratia quinivorans]|uniref:phage holin family protein n=1 Tax=Serratia quinivorans TaxID=137545 RepID=UPI00217757DB|nr:phage holin family protein [Serratia quinivorans]CAI2000903.1 Uncharacterised protein [Serratia quinivorans]
MIDKGPEGPKNIIWIAICFFSIWGGLVRYLIRANSHEIQLSWFGFISQILISGFTGLLGGLLCLETGASYYMTFFLSGLFGAMGSAGLNLLLKRFSAP